MKPHTVQLSYELERLSAVRKLKLKKNFQKLQNHSILVYFFKLVLWYIKKAFFSKMKSTHAIKKNHA